MLIETTSCPFCGKGHNTPCFAKYDNGYKCFSCGRFKISGRDLLLVEQKQTLIDLPRHRAVESLEALEYLYQYHFTDKMIRKFNITETTNNTLLYSVFEGGECTFAVERNYRHKHSMNHGLRKTHIIGEGDEIVVVEDYLSACRVSKHKKVLCLFGTSINKPTLKHLITNHDKIILWLDGDGPGQTAASLIQSKIHTQLYYTYINSLIQRKPAIYNIATDKDPKCYTDTKIKEILESANSNQEIKTRRKGTGVPNKRKLRTRLV